MTPPAPIVYLRSRENAEWFYWNYYHVQIYRHFGTRLPENILESLAASLFHDHNEAKFEEFIHELRQIGEFIGP